MKRCRKYITLQKKYLRVFAGIILIILSITWGLHLYTVKTMRQMIYDKMRMQGNDYQNLLDKEIDDILHKQIEFFNDRRLIDLGKPKISLESSEKQEALLVQREKLEAITSSDLVEDAVLYMMDSSYKISPGAVCMMNHSDWEELKQYYKNPDGVLNYDGTNYFVMLVAGVGNASERKPSFVLIVTFSSNELKLQLKQLMSDLNGDAFYYRKYMDVLIHSGDSKQIPEQILQNIKLDKDGNYQEISRMKFGRQTYLVSVCEKGNLGVLFQYCKEKPIAESVENSRIGKSADSYQ